METGFEGASQVALVVRNLPANAGDIEDEGLTPGSGRSPGGGHGNPLQYSCQENPMDRGAWWATVYRVAQSRTQLKRLSTRSWGLKTQHAERNEVEVNSSLDTGVEGMRGPRLLEDQQ